MTLTARGVLVLIASPLSFLLGEFLGFTLLRALAGAGIAALLTAWLVTTRPVKVDVYREVYPSRVERGRATMALLQLRNRSQRRQPAFVADDVLAGEHVEVPVRELAPQATVTYRYQLPTRWRGCFDVGPLTLHRHDPLGLVRTAVTNGSATQIWVHPRRHVVRLVNEGWPRHHHDGRSSPAPLVGSADLRQIREYVQGDEVRHVHWKALARTGKLMVREYDDPAEPCLTVILDNRAAALSAWRFEEAVEVAASFVATSLERGYRTRIVTTCADLDLETHAGRAAVPGVLDRMSEVETYAEDGFPPMVQGGAVVVVAGADHRHLLSSLDPGQHKVVLFHFAHDIDPGGALAPAVRSLIRADNAADAVRVWNGVPG